MRRGGEAPGVAEAAEAEEEEAAAWALPYRRHSRSVVHHQLPPFLQDHWLPAQAQAAEAEAAEAEATAERAAAAGAAAAPVHYQQEEGQAAEAPG